MTTEVNRQDAEKLSVRADQHDAVVNQPPTPQPTTDPTALRRIHHDIKQPLQELDRRQREERLQETAGLLGRRDPLELLNDIARTWGLSWHAIGRMLRVSPSAMRKWRSGKGAISPESREQIALLSAFLTTIQSCREPIADIGSWIEMRLREDTTLTPVGIYASGPQGRLLLIDLAAEIMSTVEVLDEFEPDWRTRYLRDSTFRVVDDGPGGERAIVER